MDYQRRDEKDPLPFDKEYRAFSSYNYGMVGAAAGLPLWFLLLAAGTYNRIGNFSLNDTFYSNPADNEERIGAGYRDYFVHGLQ